MEDSHFDGRIRKFVLEELFNSGWKNFMCIDIESIWVTIHFISFQHI